jgi:hypothetical protein
MPQEAMPIVNPTDGAALAITVPAEDSNTASRDVGFLLGSVIEAIITLMVVYLWQLQLGEKEGLLLTRTPLRSQPNMSKPIRREQGYHRNLRKQSEPRYLP